MADQSIFDNNQNPQATPVTSTSTPSPADKLQDLLSQIKNENGEQKYKTVEDALVGLSHSQAFIKTLREEKSALEAQFNEVKPVAEKVTELERVVLELTKPSQQAPTSASPLSEDAVAKLVETTLTKRQQEEIAKKNLTSVVDVVKQEFGDKAEEVFYSKAAEIGLSRAEINSLAARTPQAALKLIGVSGRQSTTTFKPTTPSVNTAGVTPQQDTYIGRNTKRLEVGATASELMEETRASKQMVEELGAKGLSIDDLTKPSNYFKYFK